MKVFTEVYYYKLRTNAEGAKALMKSKSKVFYQGGVFTITYAGKYSCTLSEV